MMTQTADFVPPLSLGNDDDLAEHLDSVVSSSPYYRTRVAPGAPLEQYPLMSRSEMIRNYQSIISDKIEGRDQLITALERNSSARELKNVGQFQLSGRYIVEQTSGTSGVPARFVKTKQERALLSFALWQRRKQIDPAIHPRTFLPLFHLSEGATLPVNPFDSSTEGMNRFLDWLEQTGTRWLHMPPTVLQKYILFLGRSGRARAFDRLKYIELSGAPVTEELIDLISAEDAWKVSLVNQYGTREVWGVGYAVNGCLFDVLSEVVVVELIGSDGQVVHDRNVEGAVAVTTKVLKAMPIVRYLTGDFGRWVDGPSGRLLALTGERDATTFYIGRSRISGIQFFKTAMLKVYAKTGYGGVEYLQIRKTGPAVFTVDICGPSSELVVEVLQQVYQQTDPTGRFEINRFGDAVELLKDTTRKPYLFLNQYDP